MADKTRAQSVDTERVGTGWTREYVVPARLQRSLRDLFQFLLFSKHIDCHTRAYQVD